MGRARQGHKDAEGPTTGEPPQVPTGTWVQAEKSKGGSAPAQEQRQDQARGTGRRDERPRLAGGGCRQRLGGRHFTVGEEVGRR